MCDKKHYDELEERLDCHDKRIGALEKTDAVHDVKLELLTKQVRIQMLTVWGAFFLVLLALIWGACGPDGFRAVTHEAKSISQTNN